MSQDLSTSPSNPSLALLRTVGPFVLAVVGGFGMVRFTEGDTLARLKGVEEETKSVAEARELDAQRFVTREEFKQFVDATRDDLREIKTDVRAIRSDVRNR